MSIDTDQHLSHIEPPIHIGEIMHKPIRPDVPTNLITASSVVGENPVLDTQSVSETAIPLGPINTEKTELKPDIRHLDRHIGIGSTVLDAYQQTFENYDYRMDELTDLEVEGPISSEEQREKRELQAELLKVRSKIKELGGVPVSISDMEEAEDLDGGNEEASLPIDTGNEGYNPGRDGVKVDFGDDDGIDRAGLGALVRSVEEAEVRESSFDGSPTTGRIKLDENLGKTEYSEWARPDETGKPSDSETTDEEPQLEAEIDPAQQIIDSQDELILSGDSDKSKWAELEMRAVSLRENQLRTAAKNAIRSGRVTDKQIDEGFWQDYSDTLEQEKADLEYKFAKNRAIAEGVGNSTIEAWVEVVDGQKHVHAKQVGQVLASDAEADSVEQTPAERPGRELFAKFNDWRNRVPKSPNTQEQRKGKIVQKGKQVAGEIKDDLSYSASQAAKATARGGRTVAGVFRNLRPIQEQTVPEQSQPVVQLNESRLPLPPPPVFSTEIQPRSTSGIPEILLTPRRKR